MKTAELARIVVRRQVTLGADFIKVYGWLESEVMKEVVDEAKKHNKEVSCDLLHSYQVNAVGGWEIFGVSGLSLGNFFAKKTLLHEESYSRSNRRIFLLMNSWS